MRSQPLDHVHGAFDELVEDWRVFARVWGGSPTDLWAFRGSAGRAVRMPTVAEPYQGSRT